VWSHPATTWRRVDFNLGAPAKTIVEKAEKGRETIVRPSKKPPGPRVLRGGDGYREKNCRLLNPTTP